LISLPAKLRKVERNAKGKHKFFFSFPRRSNFGAAKDTKNLSKREEKKEICFLEREDFI
jgi:hypothetical protein